MTTAPAHRVNIGIVMSTSFAQLPRPERPKPRDTSGDGAVIFAVMMFGLSLVPRAWIIGFWIFSYGLGDAFSSWVIPAVGFIVLPWTTLMYAWMWAIGSDAVHGWEWLPVVAGFLLDLGLFASLRRLF